MPVLKIDEVQRLVDAEEIGAITLDTTTFDQFGCNLAYRQLTALEQFRGTAITVLLSEITLGEVASHIARDIALAAEKARAGVNQYLKAWSGGDDIPAALKALGVARPPADRARELVDGFVDRVGADRLGVDEGVSVAEMADRYFGQRPPFSNKVGKKSEFPDAIALLSLENWAAERGTRVVAVSKDGDWQSYAAQSDRVIVIPELAAGLNLFNRESSVAAARIAGVIRGGNANLLLAALHGPLTRMVEDYEVIAGAPYFYEEENEASSLISVAFPEDATCDVVAADDDTISIATEIEMEAEFTTNFSFYVEDNVDRDEIGIGSNSVTVTERFRLPVVATFLKEAKDDPEPIDVEVEARHVAVDFGYVEPDWRGDED
ncbi:PIN domain-containing protein [Sphingomonas hankookensis]|uniref:PIN domain-containing protein n=1 Tax=Sphingomonas hankookensis TaxID=563996 RepID=UPI001F5AE2C8|nr:PIN domain-containing protein [Sphingomonas hankookensis]